MNVEALFDASALVNIIRQHGSGALDLVEGGYILTLTPYEIGNAIWKEAVLLNRINTDEAAKLLDQVSVVYNYMKTVVPRDQEKTLQVAAALRVTYYDASYITSASELNTILVTDDGKLLKIIEEKEAKLSRILGKTLDAITSNAYQT
ncbi:MAG: type II toxin-antitoxin system VapC family toxin [Desulfurococcales archaeon]|nr:type II toxin-antitoxin system VapC family toxin [Desulfurococcales archaeon]